MGHNANIVVFVGTEPVLSDVLDTMCRNSNEAAEVRNERGIPEQEKIQIFSTSTLKDKLVALNESYA